MPQQLLMGNEAFAHAALEAGVRVVAGYPGTPSSELIETVAKLHASGSAHGVHVEWSTNEKAALELVAGASVAGARVLFTCKQVGLNVASDALLSLNYVGVRGGTVLFVADDPGPISSQTEQDTRRFAAFAKVPVLDPSTPEEGFAMMKEAYLLSERYGTPVIVRPTTRICHASTFFDVEEETWALDVPEGGFEKDPRWVIFPKRSFQAHGEINERLRTIATDPAYTRFTAIERRVPSSGAPTGAEVEAEAEPAKLAIVASGVSAAYAQEALASLERLAEREQMALPPYRFIRMGSPYPFPDDLIAQELAGIERIIVFEELDSVVEEELLKLAGARHLPYRVLGKLTGDARDRGENTAEDIRERLVRFFATEAPTLARQAEDARPEPIHYEGTLPVRPPVLCAGCPHRGSFYAVKRALKALGKQAKREGKPPVEAVLCGDIGCYTLGNAAPLDAVDTCLCMGAGITMAQGLAVVEPQKKHVAFVGDSTFFASVLTGIANAVYNGHDVMFAILDNSTTAMTGSQPHPGTGVTLMGQKRAPLVIEDVLEALGVERIRIVDPLDTAASVEAATDCLGFPGPSAVIFRSPCIQIVPPGEPMLIDAGVCTGCKRCITEIGCPAIGFDATASSGASSEPSKVDGNGKAFRGIAYIDDALCTGCGLCVPLCPFDAIGSADRKVGA